MGNRQKADSPNNGKGIGQRLLIRHRLEKTVQADCTLPHPFLNGLGVNKKPLESGPEMIDHFHKTVDGTTQACEGDSTMCLEVQPQWLGCNVDRKLDEDTATET